jgi:hypothetical protein
MNNFEANWESFMRLQEKSDTYDVSIVGYGYFVRDVLYIDDRSFSSFRPGQFVNSCRRFEESWCLRKVGNCQSMRRNIPEDLIIQRLRCGNFKPNKLSIALYCFWTGTESAKQVTCRLEYNFGNAMFITCLRRQWTTCDIGVTTQPQSQIFIRIYSIKFVFSSSMSVASRSLKTGFTERLLLSSVAHERRSEFRSCFCEELDEAKSTAGTKVSAGT